MIISIVAAVDENLGIGYQGKIPWHISSDLKRFRKLTIGHHILMGRKTYQSIGKPLADRVNLVISRDKNFSAPGCKVFGSIDDAINFASGAGETELFVIGGEDIFREILPRADMLYLTEVLASCKVDKRFPQFDQHAWRLIKKQHFPAGERDDHATIYKIFRRKKILQ